MAGQNQVDEGLLRQWEAEIPRQARANHELRLAAGRIGEIAEGLAQRALRRQDEAKRRMRDARTELERQAAEGEYLQAVDDRRKALVVYAAARKNLSELARG